MPLLLAFKAFSSLIHSIIVDFVDFVNLYLTAGFILRKSIFCDQLIFQFEGAERKLVTLIPGDGVGPELAGAVKHVFRLVLLKFFVSLYSVDLEMKANNC